MAFPTDTVYGLGCDPFNDRAVERLFVVKGREAKPVSILCDSLEKARRLVQLDGVSLALAKKHWPGALTIVARRTVSVPEKVDQGTGEVGVRVPDHVMCLEFIRMSGGYVTGTSANLSGMPSCRDPSEVNRALGEKLDLILDGGIAGGLESTVVRVSGGTTEILRKGAVVDPGLP